MRIRTIIGAAAVSVLGAGAAALIPLAASAAPGGPAATVHTLKFTSVTLKSMGFTKTTFGGSDYEVNAKGKVIGYDVISGSFNPKTNKVAINVAVAIPGGIMYLASTDGVGDKGVITGGTGNYKHAQGKFVSKSINKAETKTAVTITFTT